MRTHTTQAAFRPGGRHFFLSGLRSDLTGFLRPFYATPPNRCDSNRPIAVSYTHLDVYKRQGIKSRTVGDGQHGTARWASRSEIRKTYKHIPFTPEQWREQAKAGKPPATPEGQPLPQGIVVGCTGNTTAMVDTGDVHALMIGAAGVGKTAYWLYPCIEYACASGMSFLSTDTKGDILSLIHIFRRGYGDRTGRGNRRSLYGYAVR